MVGMECLAWHDSIRGVSSRPMADSLGGRAFNCHPAQLTSGHRASGWVMSMPQQQGFSLMPPHFHCSHACHGCSCAKGRCTKAAGAACLAVHAVGHAPMPRYAVAKVLDLEAALEPRGKEATKGGNDGRAQGQHYGMQLRHTRSHSAGCQMRDQAHEQVQLGRCGLLDILGSKAELDRSCSWMCIVSLRIAVAMWQGKQQLQ